MCNIQNKGFRRKGAGVNSRKILSRGGEVLTGYCFTLNVCFKCLLSRYMPTFTVHCTLFDVHVTNKILNLKSYQHSYQIVLNRWQVWCANMLRLYMGHFLLRETDIVEKSEPNTNTYIHAVLASNLQRSSHPESFLILRSVLLIGHLSFHIPYFS